VTILSTHSPATQAAPASLAPPAQPSAPASRAPTPAVDAAPTPRSTDGRPRHRITGLDALRGIAAFSVLVGHYTHNYNRLYGHSDELLFSYPHAGYGVTLFFMISGFVILMTVERTARPADFLWARFSRLYPAYWTAVAVTFTVLTLFALPGRQPTLGRALVNLTMVQNWLGVANVDGVYWTLHVEIYFYAMMFFLLWRGWVRFTEFFLLGLVGLGLLRAWLFSDVTSGWVERLSNVLILDHAFAFLIGVILYRSIHAPRRWHVLAIALCLAYPLLFGRRFDFYVTCGLAALVLLTTRGYLRVLDSRVLVFVGTISYSLYLTHQNIGYLVIRTGYRLGLNPNASIALAAAVAVLIAAGITYLVERPAMTYLRGHRPSFLRPGAPPAAALPAAATPA
jgi:peptidoglycan/LPS O-acetylase OafA/YrhL